MSDILTNTCEELNQRKEQALELNITLTDDMTQECIEQEITDKLESGMRKI